MTVTVADHDSRRRELATFLRSRRDRLAPEAVGLPRGTRRRAPGLRREEVAQLAGVGVTWYTWLEQGRSINVSTQVLTAIARALRLTADERGHLFTLAGVPDDTLIPEEEVVTGALQTILDSLDPLPAHVTNARYDALAWNRADAALLGDMRALPPHRRNIMWQLFTQPAWRDMFGGWDGDTARRCVARFRRNFAAHVGDPAWQGLLDELSALSPEFRALWDRQEVESHIPKVKSLLHPLLGPTRFAVTSLWYADQPGTRIVIYTPCGQEAERTRRMLAEMEPWLPWQREPEPAAAVG